MNNKYLIDTPENKEFLKQNASELIEFGRCFASPMGGSYYLGDDGTPWKDRNIETWITCRMAHVYSIASFMNVIGAADLAAKALKGLMGGLKDKDNGGWYAGITPEGKILPDKQCYAHAFVILAACSLKLAGIPGAEELLKDALEVYDRFFWDEERGLPVDTWNTEFTKLDTYRGVNASMHSVEAFLAVADVNHDETYRVRAGRIIDHVLKWAEDNNWRIPEHFNENWEPNLELNADKKDDPFKPYGATCGHGIEWGRLIVQWALSTYKDKDKATKYIEAAENLFKRAIADGWNADGAKGIVYTTDWNGKPVVRDRMHWTLAEAINTSAVLYRVTGKEEFAAAYSDFLQYFDEDVHDKVNGSWFHQLDENNKLKGTVWPGKSDIYHALQAMLIPYHRPDLSIAAAVKEEK